MMIAASDMYMVRPSSPWVGSKAMLGLLKFCSRSSEVMTPVAGKLLG